MKLAVLLLFAVGAIASPVLDLGDENQVVFPGLVDDAAPEAGRAKAVASSVDPVAAVLALHPELESFMATPRLLKVEDEIMWATEGEKLRLRKAGKGFIDYTDVGVPSASPRRMMAHTPKIQHQDLVRPLLGHILTSNMRLALAQMTTVFPNRYYQGIHGQQSAQWLHRFISTLISAPVINPTHPSPMQVSLGWHTHRFAQSTIIARFEPPILNASAPLTIISAHQDSINYENPMDRAPGANDNASGSISILEAFRILLQAGFVPQRGPVEFHWYAGEEGGLLGSLDRAKYTQDLGFNVGAILHYDMTAYVSKREGIEEHMGILRTETDDDLTEWVLDLAKEYVSIPARGHYIRPGGASDHYSWWSLGYPAAAADSHDGSYAKTFGPLHTINDSMTFEDEGGYFSVDHMARYTELAIAFAVEQAGWGKYPEPQTGL